MLHRTAFRLLALGSIIAVVRGQAQEWQQCMSILSPESRLSSNRTFIRWGNCMVYPFCVLLRLTSIHSLGMDWRNYLCLWYYVHSIK